MRLFVHSRESGTDGKLVNTSELNPPRFSLRSFTRKANISWSLKAQFRTVRMVQDATWLLETNLSRKPLQKPQRMPQLLLQSVPVPAGEELPMQLAMLPRTQTIEE